MKLKEIKCISDLYYVIGGWFTILMFAIAIWTLPIALDIYDSVWSFLMCAALAFVGAAPHFRDKFEGKVHYVAAVVSAISSLNWTAAVCPAVLLLFAIGVILALCDRTRTLLWLEIPCFLMVYTAIVANFL